MRNHLADCICARGVNSNCKKAESLFFSLLCHDAQSVSVERVCVPVSRQDMATVRDTAVTVELALLKTRFPEEVVEDCGRIRSGIYITSLLLYIATVGSVACVTK